MIVITIGAVIVASIVVSLLTFWLPDGVDDFAQEPDLEHASSSRSSRCAWTLMYFALAQGRSASTGRRTRGVLASATAAERRPDVPLSAE